MGKTIEACLVLKEYWMRGMVRKALVLAPPSLVSQWKGELTEKFGLAPGLARHGRSSAATRSSSGNRSRWWSPPSPWRGWTPTPRPSPPQPWDMVIVDEAHCLKNRTSANWQLVDSLQKKFILMLTATPVENNLLELYNLITLLKPGLLATEAEFRKTHVTSGQTESAEESRAAARPAGRCDDSQHARRGRRPTAAPHRGHRGRSAVGSGSADLRYGVAVRRRSAVRARRRRHWRWICCSGRPAAARWRLAVPWRAPWARNPGCRRATAANWKRFWSWHPVSRRAARERNWRACSPRIPAKRWSSPSSSPRWNISGGICEEHGISHALFSGDLSRADKDAAIASFRDQARVLLSTGAGGEGRNLQFADTVINFDLPWNPMRLEQRIGRVHRIGQTHDVFVFNFCQAGHRGRADCCACCTTRSTCSSWWWARWMPFWARWTTPGTFAEIVMDLWISGRESGGVERDSNELADPASCEAKKQHALVQELDDVALRARFRGIADGGDHRLGPRSSRQVGRAGRDGGGRTLRALLTPELAGALHASEWLSLRFGVGAGSDDEGEWLERLGHLLPPDARVISARLRRPRLTPPIDPRAVLERELVIQNGIYRLLDSYPETARYYFFGFQYTIESDETSLGLWTVGLNASARSLTEQPESMLQAMWDDLEEDPAFGITREELLRLFPLALGTAQPAIRRLAAATEHNANRRLARDAERINAYYSGLLRQIGKRISRHAANPDAAAKERSRAAATELDRAAKLEDLKRKYSLKIRIDPGDVLVVSLPVREISVRLIRKKAERVAKLHWNPALRVLESPWCENCVTRAYPLFLCDDHVHCLCKSCWTLCQPKCNLGAVC